MRQVVAMGLLLESLIVAQAPMPAPIPPPQIPPIVTQPMPAPPMPILIPR